MFLRASHTSASTFELSTIWLAWILRIKCMLPIHGQTRAFIWWQTRALDVKTTLLHFVISQRRDAPYSALNACNTRRSRQLLRIILASTESQTPRTRCAHNRVSAEPDSIAYRARNLFIHIITALWCTYLAMWIWNMVFNWLRALRQCGATTIRKHSARADTRRMVRTQCDLNCAYTRARTSLWGLNLRSIFQTTHVRLPCVCVFVCSYNY